MALDDWSATSYLDYDLATGTDFRSDTVGTLSFWLYRDAGTGGAAVSFNDSGSNNNFLTYTGLALRIKSSSDLINHAITNTTANTWVHVSIVQKGDGSADSYAVYYDNVDVGSGTTTAWLGSLASLDKFTIGAWQIGSTTGWPAGPIGDVAYWSAALESDERAALDAGVSPAFIRPDVLRIHNKALNTASAINAFDDHTWVENGVGLTDAGHHPPVGPRFNLAIASAPLIEVGAPPAGGAVPGSLSLMGVGI